MMVVQKHTSSDVLRMRSEYFPKRKKSGPSFLLCWLFVSRPVISALFIVDFLI
jgi:hypothetical protein